MKSHEQNDEDKNIKSQNKIKIRKHLDFNGKKYVTEIKLPSNAFKITKKQSL